MNDTFFCFRKELGPKFTVEKTLMDEDEFRATGGLVGSVERARSLLNRKKITPARRLEKKFNSRHELL